MRHFIPTLLIALFLSSCANNPQVLKYQSVVSDTEETTFTSAIVTTAPTVNNEINHTRQDKAKFQGESHDYLKKVTEKSHRLVAQRLDDCFISLKPDYCWYADLAEFSNTQTIDDLTLKYLNNPAHESKQPCTVSEQPCTSFYNQTVAFVNYPTNAGHTLEQEVNNPRDRVVLDFVSITINY
jgi:hypothetical protein